jgi:hypothetical protein
LILGIRPLRRFPWTTCFLLAAFPAGRWRERLCAPCRRRAAGRGRLRPRGGRPLRARPDGLAVRTLQSAQGRFQRDQTGRFGLAVLPGTVRQLRRRQSQRGGVFGRRLQQLFVAARDAHVREVRRDETHRGGFHRSPRHAYPLRGSAAGQCQAARLLVPQGNPAQGRSLRRGPAQGGLPHDGVRGLQPARGDGGGLALRGVGPARRRPWRAAPGRCQPVSRGDDLARTGRAIAQRTRALVR